MFIERRRDVKQSLYDAEIEYIYADYSKNFCIELPISAGPSDYFEVGETLVTPVTGSGLLFTANTFNQFNANYYSYNSETTTTTYSTTVGTNATDGGINIKLGEKTSIVLSTTFKKYNNTTVNLNRPLKQNINKIYIFGNLSNYYTRAARLYSFYIKINNTKVYDLIPVRKGNIGYLYDKISGKLFANSGTGNFILGPDIGGSNYSKQYLTFEALEAGTFTLTIPSALTTSSYSNISYSIDNGDTWTTTSNVANTEVIVTTPTIPAKGKVIWMGTGSQLGNSSSYSNFTSTGKFNVYGNLLSLFRNINFANYTAIGTGGRVDYYARHLFYNNQNIISAKNMIFPINYGLSCMSGTFNGCSNLIEAPSIPASTVYQSSQESMFRNCTSLVKAPELAASSIGARSYWSMFYGCSKLNYVRCLATSKSTNNPISNWLTGVSTTGTFVKSADIEDSFWTDSIPSGWTIKNV